jgi:monoamine oxidase
MGRTPLFRRVQELFGTPRRASGHGPSRREVLATGAAAFGAAAIGSLPGCGAAEGEPTARTQGALVRVNADIGVVGAGMAGLAFAYEMKRAGNIVTVHEGNTRAGGRVWSMSGTFPGQVIERGGELIDTPHKTMLGYVNEFGLSVEDVSKPRLPTAFNFGGQSISEAAMVEEYRVLVDAMRDDLRAIGAPTAASFTPAEAALDRTSLREYLQTRGAGSNIAKLLNVAYAIEYGVETDQLSCLAFLLFAKASRQSKLRLWGNFSDERYHVVTGNQGVVDALVARLPNQIRYGRKLVRVAKTAAGRIELTFVEGKKTTIVTHDAVVLTLPFTVLRDVELDASLGLPAWKTQAIQGVVYGTNAKLMVGFTSRPWLAQGSNGAAYSDLPYLQTTWETNAVNGSATSGVLTDYTGGLLGASLSDAQADTARFLGDLDKVYPGAKAAARKDSRGNYVAHLEAWPKNPWTKGSYTANQPGYFTTICDNEAKAVGNLYFAGETTSSFYEWQGFMEGAALSGLRAANEVVNDFK